ncbi:MAG: LytR C-terminal domain-containing protein [bacterium]|nr:LytR C-terminal domain-containing protein [bacterium]
MAAQKSVKHKLTRRKVVNQRKKPQYFVRWIFLLGVFILLFWGGWRLFGLFRNRVWRGDARITFVVHARDPIIYSLSPTQKLLSFKIPGNTQIETVGEYGTFPAGSLWELGQQKGKGGELLRLSIQRSLGISVDAWIGEGGGEFFSPRPLSRIVALKEAILGGGIATNLTFFDRLALLINLSSVNSADKKSLDLETSRVLKKQEFPDGASGFVVVPEQAKLIFQALRDEGIVREGKTLIVVNTTPQHGLAGKVADVAGALGVRVIAAQTEGSARDGHCVIRGKKEDLGSLSARRLSQVFQCEREDGEARGGAKLEIILGRDFVNTF